jgi:plasmid stability protein
MRQLLLRVPDDLHQRLSARAHREGRSVNALATEMLDATVQTESGSPRDIVRARAAARGLLRTIETNTSPVLSIEAARARLAGLTITATELIDEQRRGR